MTGKEGGEETGRGSQGGHACGMGVQATDSTTYSLNETQILKTDRRWLHLQMYRA